MDMDRPTLAARPRDAILHRRERSRSPRPGLLVVTILLALAGLRCSASDPARNAAAGEMSAGRETESAAPAADVVTYENLYAHEAYWPYHVELTESWKPEGYPGDQLGWGIGVLVRVEPEGDLRMDFGRFGKYRVPARVTNVVEEANRIRLGERPKSEPNFVLAVVNKLLDPTADPIRYLKPGNVTKVRAFLLVAADPETDAFAEIAESFASLHDRADVMPVLLPQGRHADGAVLKRCQAVGWRDPFATSRFAPGFTRSILGEDVPLPSVMLQSPEGRVFYDAPWAEGTAAVVAAVIGDELGDAPLLAADTQEASETGPEH